MLELLVLQGMICILLDAQEGNFSKLQVCQCFSCKCFSGHKMKHGESYILNRQFMLHLTVYHLMNLLPYFCDCVSILLPTSSQSISLWGFSTRGMIKEFEINTSCSAMQVVYKNLFQIQLCVLQHLFHKFLVPALLMGEYQHLFQQIKHLVQFLLVVPHNINSYTTRRKKTSDEHDILTVRSFLS